MVLQLLWTWAFLLVSFELVSFSLKLPFFRSSLLPKPAEIFGDQQVHPGDYVSHENFGVGVFKGIMGIPLRKNDPREVDFLHIQFQDAELVLSWIQGKEQLFLNRKLDMTEAVSTQRSNAYLISDTKKWERRRLDALSNTKKELVYLMDLYRERAEKYRTPSIEFSAQYEDFEENFPYEPTPDQDQCFQDIARDMVNLTMPMNRLVCGDVGFGKTEVAFRALYRAVLSGKQVAFMAPTRLLAMQHFKSLTRRIPDLRVACLHSGVRTDQVQQIKQALVKGDLDVLVGTQSILNDGLQYKNLGLLVIDEEQRFGVNHKVKLMKKYVNIDVLTLTATPIPRTLKQAMDGLVDISILETPPIERRPVIIEIVEPTKSRGSDRLPSSLHQQPTKGTRLPSISLINFDAVARGLQKERERGGQSFVICPFIDNLPMYEREIKRRLPDISVIIVHGRMDNIDENVEIFADGGADVLLATTVIENGLNLPHVNSIFIGEAERFGLATLYQLKGRVGRGNQQAYAYFLLGSQQALQGDAESRLTAIQSFQDLGSGRKIAEADMGIRGAGSMYGTNQSGMNDWIGPGLTNRYAELQSLLLGARTILPARDTLMILNDELEHIAETHDPSLVLPQDATNIRHVAMFELAIMRAVLRTILSGESASYSRDASPPVKQQDEIDTAALEKSLIRLLSEDDEKQASNDIARVFHGRIPPLMKQLMARARLRRHSRRAGIQSIWLAQSLFAKENPRGWVLIMEKMSKDKWALVSSHAQNGHDQMILGSIDAQFDPDRMTATLFVRDASRSALETCVRAIENAAQAMFQDVSSSRPLLKGLSDADIK